MKFTFTLDLATGPNSNEFVYREDLQKTIDAVDRCIKGQQKSLDFVYLVDLKCILETMQKQLP